MCLKNEQVFGLLKPQIQELRTMPFCLSRKWKIALGTIYYAGILISTVVALILDTPRIPTHVLQVECSSLLVGTLWSSGILILELICMLGVCLLKSPDGSIRRSTFIYYFWIGFGLFCVKFVFCFLEYHLFDDPCYTAFQTAVPFLMTMFNVTYRLHLIGLAGLIVSICFHERLCGQTETALTNVVPSDQADMVLSDRADTV